MNDNLAQFLDRVHQQFLQYYSEFLATAERAPQLFVSGDFDKRHQDDLLRVQLYRLATEKSVHFAKESFKESELFNYNLWAELRTQFQGIYADELATTYFTSVMRKVFAQQGTAIEFGDDGIAHKEQKPDKLIAHFPLETNKELKKAIELALTQSVFAHALSESIYLDREIIVDIIGEQLKDNSEYRSLDFLVTPFFRGKGAYLVAQLVTRRENVPLVLGFVHSGNRIVIDGVLVGYKATRSFLFSSTRSSFTVSTRNYQELYTFLRQLYPAENRAYFLDIIGFTHPAKVALLQQVRDILSSGEKFRYLGIGPVDFVFGVKGFPLVFKVIRKEVADRQAVIHNFIKVHTIDRLGQILDSLDYRHVKFPKSQFSEKLLEKLHREMPEDVEITSDYVSIQRVYAMRRIIPVIEQVRKSSKKEARELLLRVGWNIKHLAAMGFFPKSLGLGHFGLTSWGRVVYLDNASLVDVRLLHFHPKPALHKEVDEFYVDTTAIEDELQIPAPHNDTFRAIHGDLFSTNFWEDIKKKVFAGQYPDFFPYPSRFRLESRKFRSSVFQELQRMSDTADAGKIHMAFDSLAVVEVELAGLSFLRLEVPSPSAKVLVIEPIGPEIIAQLHHRFKDVTFDILQSESEVVESAGQWTPGIHGRLNTLVQVRQYDHVIGYVNETFDENFFRLAKLKGFLLLSTGTHNIDIEAATKYHTVVTNAPGPTTTTVAEQNIGLMLDAIYKGKIRDQSGEIKPEKEPVDLATKKTDALTTARILWFAFLQKTLKLEEMFSFGASELYVRTGVGERATVYHDQIGQNREAGIARSVGITRLNEIGLHLVEFSVIHEVSIIYVCKEEYRALDPKQKKRLSEIIQATTKTATSEELSIEIVPVLREDLHGKADYTINASLLQETRSKPRLQTNSRNIEITELDVLHSQIITEPATTTLTVGIQGLGRIGEAVARRAIILGFNVLIHQRDPSRQKYQDKLHHLNKIAAHFQKWTGKSSPVRFAEGKSDFFSCSNIITTLAATTSKTKGWVDTTGLSIFGTRTSSPTRVIISAGKGLVDEDALLQFLTSNPQAQARLDVLVSEHEGGAYKRLFAQNGEALPNIKITGHTAAAVREVRQLKIYKALNNLRNLIDGRIPPNIVNNRISKGAQKDLQGIVEIENLQFFRLRVPDPKARVLVIEPLPPELVLQLQQRFSDVTFDILLAESELIKIDGHWTPGINSRLNKIVTSQKYDYVLGYCNANFNEQFFSLARIKGLILFATATHHINLETATLTDTIVTNSPGFTTVAVTEQNIGMALDGVYGKHVQNYQFEHSTPLHQLTNTKDSAQTVSQIMWFSLLRQALKLDDMYKFGIGDKYVRTGVRRDATVYHDQLGQYNEAGINNTLAIIGLDEVGVFLAELAIVFEISTILVWEEEYTKLSQVEKKRLDDLIQVVSKVTSTKPFAVVIKPVDKDELQNHATYTFKTPAACLDQRFDDFKPKSQISVSADKIFVNLSEVEQRSLIGLTFGVQGLGRIGEAVVQRALALGANIIVCQRDPKREKYQEKQRLLRCLAKDRATVFNTKIDVKYVEKNELFSKSNVVTTLAATTSQTRYWVDRAALEMLGSEANTPVKVLVNAGKGLLDETDLALFLPEHGDVEIRLDVLSDEQVGKAGKRFLDSAGNPFTNLKIAGHTAAAVPELRRLKIFNALNNLRLHLDGKRPKNILNPEMFEKS